MGKTAKFVLGVLFLVNCIIAAGIAYVMVTAPMQREQGWIDIAVNSLFLAAAASMIWGIRYGMSRPAWTVAAATNTALLFVFCWALVFHRQELAGLTAMLTAVLGMWLCANLSALILICSRAGWPAGRPG